MKKTVVPVVLSSPHPGRRPPGALIGLAAAALAAGCGGSRGPAAATSVRLEEEASWKRTLTPAEQAEAEAALRSVAGGHTPVAPPAPASPQSGGKRWADVRAAVTDACHDVEAAVVRAVERADGGGYRFHLRTIEDWPGVLTVERVDGPDVYRAEASIGRFPDEATRRARADALLAALATRMEAYGRKRAFPEE